LTLSWASKPVFQACVQTGETMAKMVMRPAVLEPRETDQVITDEEYLKISLFRQLKQKPSLDRFPGAVRLRRYAKGETICWQGEAGWTAFYGLTGEDVKAIRRRTETSTVAGRPGAVLPAESPSNDETSRTIATVYLSLPQARPQQKGVFQRLTSRLAGRSAVSKPAWPLSIPIDGPRDLDSNTLQTALYEGELFGEMSCMYRTPRSATVVAARECYILEMLRHILDALQKDPAYRKRTEEIYKQRVLEMHLRKLAIFSDLKDDEYARIYSEIRGGLELVSYEAGQVICDEYDRSDCVYIIRNGLVRTVKGVSALLSPADILDLPKLISILRDAKNDTSKPAAALLQFVGTRAQDIVTRAHDLSTLDESDRAGLVDEFNGIIKNKQFLSCKGSQLVVSGAAFQEKTREPSEQRAELTDRLKKTFKGASSQELEEELWKYPVMRKLNRLLFEALLPGCIRPLPPASGHELVLSYLGRGEFIGEMGLMAREARSATCEAFAHPSGAGRAELVRVPEAVFWKIVHSSDGARRVVELAITERSKRTIQALHKPAHEKESQMLFSPRFQDLGLIQGQHLMLIDLDRCTRCDECVRACVQTHDDERTRLFLDGPRYGRYLVPTTCRSCLDPVCLIGCPVGSIHRHHQDQIVIENWCIGCGQCAEQCPYGSIQMHDIGVIPERALGWRYFPAALLHDANWQRIGFRDHSWIMGRAPFRWHRDFRASLSPMGKHQQEPLGDTATVFFRLQFRLSRDRLGASGQFRFKVTSTDPSLALWVNGRELTADGKPKRGVSEYSLPSKQAAPDKPSHPSTIFFNGRNVVAVRATADPKSADVLLDLRLDEIRQPAGAEGPKEEIVEKLVTEQAVVCDLCSKLPSGPACVSACPHDAAMRVNARFDFPIR
jgi:Fe-S-cluster-containing hydrogenase component 2/CRP-like cAMP-binding protein